jgi:hypothetical protein
VSRPRLTESELLASLSSILPASSSTIGAQELIDDRIDPSACPDRLPEELFDERVLFPAAWASVLLPTNSSLVVGKSLIRSSAVSVFDHPQKGPSVCQQGSRPIEECVRRLE